MMFCTSVPFVNFNNFMRPNDFVGISDTTSSLWKYFRITILSSIAHCEWFYRTSTWLIRRIVDGVHANFIRLWWFSGIRTVGSARLNSGLISCREQRIQIISSIPGRRIIYSSTVNGSKSTSCSIGHHDTTSPPITINELLSDLRIQLLPA